jgi:hypothetical protein
MLGSSISFAQQTVLTNLDFNTTVYGYGYAGDAFGGIPFNGATVANAGPNGASGAFVWTGDFSAWAGYLYAGGGFSQGLQGAIGSNTAAGNFIVKYSLKLDNYLDLNQPKIGVQVQFNDFNNAGIYQVTKEIPYDLVTGGWQTFVTTLAGGYVNQGSSEDLAANAANITNLSFNFQLPASGANGLWGSAPNATASVSNLTVIQGLPSVPTFSGDDSGSWFRGASWMSTDGSNTAPNGVGASALLGSSITADTLLYVNSPLTLGNLQFNSANAYVLSGTKSLTLSNSGSGGAVVDVVSGSHKLALPVKLTGSAAINVADGSGLTISDRLSIPGGATVTKNGTGTLTVQSALDVSGPATLKINGGTVNLDAVGNVPNLTVRVDPATLNVGANTTLGALTLELGNNSLVVGRNAVGNAVQATLQAASLAVTGGTGNVVNVTAGSVLAVSGNITIDTSSSVSKEGNGTVTAAAIKGGGALSVGGGSVTIARSNVLGSVSVVSSLGISAGATVNLNNTDMIIKGGVANLAAIRAYAASYLSSQTGLGTSSTTPYTRLAVFPNTTANGLAYFTSYDGVGVTSSDVIVKYTYIGDTNLDGVLDGKDYKTVFEGFITGQSGWQWGDVDYSDGATNVADLTSFLAAYNYVTNPANNATSFGNGQADNSSAAAIPEPSVGLAAIVTSGLLASRRRR